MMNELLSKTAIGLMERGLLPDRLVRRGIRSLCKQRLEDISSEAPETQVAAFLEELRRSPIACQPEKANEQHYELPAEFFQRVLGPHLKYSSCVWTEGVNSLGEAEAQALVETCDRAGLADGQSILELGCGWGSLSLWMAERYPLSRITSVSNSAPQRAFIEQRAAERGLRNLEVITADMNDFDAPGRYDRIVSVEMFEHMRNYDRLFERVASWLAPGGSLFAHIFCHRDRAYPFETDGTDNWMGRYFFTGGIMPSADLLGRFPEHLRVSRQWRWDGTHYQKTAEAWLGNLDANREAVMPVLRAAYGPEANRWFHRWRVFFMSCAELFGYCDGTEWFVTHIRFEASQANTSGADRSTAMAR